MIQYLASLGHNRSFPSNNCPGSLLCYSSKLVWKEYRYQQNRICATAASFQMVYSLGSSRLIKEAPLITALLHSILFELQTMPNGNITFLLEGYTCNSSNYSFLLSGFTVYILCKALWTDYSPMPWKVPTFTAEDHWC